MSSSHVLLVGEKGRFPSDFPSTIGRESRQEVLAEATSVIQEALSRISEKGFDAVVCWADRHDELAAVIRIRKANPQLPILVLTAQTDRGFAALARQMGATKVARCHPDGGVVSQIIRLAVQTGELAREMNARAGQAHLQGKEVRILARENRELAQAAWTAVRKSSHLGFVPLLIEDDPDQGLLMLEAFEKLGIPTLLPVLRSGAEVIDYFSEAAPFENRSRYPFPSVVLLDGDLGDMSGIEVLEWIRRQPGLARLPVVMLSSASDPEHLQKAYGVGANSFLHKPTNLQGFVDLVSQLRVYWGTLNRPPG